MSKSFVKLGKFPLNFEIKILNERGKCQIMNYQVIKESNTKIRFDLFN